MTIHRISENYVINSIIYIWLLLLLINYEKFNSIPIASVTIHKASLLFHFTWKSLILWWYIAKLYSTCNRDIILDLSRIKNKHLLYLSEVELRPIGQVALRCATFHPIKYHVKTTLNNCNFSRGQLSNMVTIHDQRYTTWRECCQLLITFS